MLLLLRTSRGCLLPPTELSVWEPRYIAAARTRITGNTSRDRYSLLRDVTSHHRKHISRDPYTILRDGTSHALYSNGLCADTKKHLQSIVAWCVGWNILTEPLPSNALRKSVTI
jgi:hypothetical protein